MITSLPPNEKGIPYTIPTILTPEGQWIMDSGKIARYIESAYPSSPPLRISDDPNLAEVEDLTRKTMLTTLPDFLRKNADAYLGDRCLEYYRLTRKEWYNGRSIDQVTAEDGGPKVYEEARPFVERVGEMLRKDESGPFFLGKEVSYSDFVWCALLKMFEGLGKETFEMLVGAAGDADVHVRVLEGCLPWLKRNDH
jgi:glutathione S-transferase